MRRPEYHWKQLRKDISVSKICEKKLGKLWKLKAEVVPVVAVILGTISRYLKF